MEPKTIYGLVLGGGGARGAYQIGAWKALNKMGIRVSAVTGASIGAINGAFFAQGDLRKAEMAWRQLNLYEVIRLENLPVIDNLFDIRNFNQLMRVIMVERGLDTTPLGELMRRYIDENTVRSSPIDFGIITYDLTTMRPIEIFKGDMPEGSLFDYLLASSCLPVFKTVEIDGNRFVDGGIYNNLPVDMVAERGIRDIIVIDIGGIERIRVPRFPDLNIITVRPRVPLGGILDMKPAVLRQNVKRGMLDTYRAFEKLLGSDFYLTVRSTKRFIRTYGQSVLDGLEAAAVQYGIDSLRIYTPEKLFALTEKRFMEDSMKYRLLRCRQRQALREHISRERLRFGRLEKDFLIPAAVEVLGDPSVKASFKDLMRRLMPLPCKAADALLVLGVRLSDYCPETAD